MSPTISHTHPSSWREDPRKVDLDKHLAAYFWASMFILAGVIWLFPDERIPDGTWLVGIGLILLALNAVRLMRGIPIRMLPTILGALALAAGLAAYAGAELPLVALTMLAIGASIIIELMPSRQR